MPTYNTEKHIIVRNIPVILVEHIESIYTVKYIFHGNKDGFGCSWSNKEEVFGWRWLQ